MTPMAKRLLKYRLSWTDHVPRWSEWKNKCANGTQAPQRAHI
eukprot:CAMPEP_0183385576 /NCGR_PEP_ID=MMETSP0370-20130417/1589_1 /TAXON_ID=268820 /ORGANISM="Peridinium aciculiferum, Strain PAER-2" /LENGTH=41 /DNA_ID= /DNA_START= /DNA_END= /DNA_ORIENTATION=